MVCYYFAMLQNSLNMNSADMKKLDEEIVNQYDNGATYAVRMLSFQMSL
jgi:hypothetical protein